MRLRELDDLFVDTLDAMVEAIDEAETRMAETDNKRRMTAAPILFAQAIEILEEQRHGILAAQQRQLDYLTLAEDHAANNDDATDADKCQPRRSGAKLSHAPKLRQ